MGMFDEVLENVGEPYKGGGKGFEYGTHEVTIGVIEPGQKKVKTNPEAEVIVVTVYDPADTEKTAEATLYFHTEGGAKMSITKVLGLLVHNVGEEKKEAVRTLGKKLFGEITDPIKARDIAAKLMAEKLAGKKGFLFVDPQGTYKTSSYGDLWHYAYEDPEADEKIDKAADVEGAPLTPEEQEQVPDFDDL